MDVLCPLSDQKCVPCEGGMPPLTQKEIDEYQTQLTTSWEVVDGKKIRRQLKFKTFTEAITFVNKVAEVAEKQKHHPDIYIFYNKVILELWTHAIGGLSPNDFIMASKIEKL